MKTNMKDNWVVCADDYHEFEFAEENYLAAGIETNHEEVGWHYGCYRAVFWLKGTEKPVKLIELSKSA